MFRKSKRKKQPSMQTISARIMPPVEGDERDVKACLQVRVLLHHTAMPLATEQAALRVRATVPCVTLSDMIDSFGVQGTARCGPSRVPCTLTTNSKTGFVQQAAADSVVRNHRNDDQPVSANKKVWLLVGSADPPFCSRKHQHRTYHTGL